eukprot:6508961-Pyramimonas_sp.AAC.1
MYPCNNRARVKAGDGGKGGDGPRIASKAHVEHRAYNSIASPEPSCIHFAVESPSRRTCVRRSQIS